MSLMPGVFLQFSGRFNDPMRLTSIRVLHTHSQTMPKKYPSRSIKVACLIFLGTYLKTIKDSFVVSPKSGICDVVSGPKILWPHARHPPEAMTSALETRARPSAATMGNPTTRPRGLRFFSALGVTVLENSWNHRALGIFLFFLPRFFDSYPFGALIPVMCFSLVWWMKESKRKKKLEWDEITP